MARYGEWNGSYSHLLPQYNSDLTDCYFFLESLCGCCDDCGSCCCVLCGCAPCLFGQNAEKIDGSSCCLMCLAYGCLLNFSLCWIPHCIKRKDLRNRYGLREEPCGDCPTTFCCGPCALCQEARFLKRQGKSNNEKLLFMKRSLYYYRCGRHACWNGTSRCNANDQSTVGALLNIQINDI